MALRATARLVRGRGGALLLAALVATVGGIALDASGVLAGIERQSISARFQLRDTPPPKGVVVVAIDDVTFSELRLQWPFKRSLHARVIDRLHHAGAAEIVYDVQFTEPTDPHEDTALYNSLGRAGGGLLATSEVDRHGHTNVLGGDDNLAAIHAVAASSSLPVDPDGVKTRFDYSVAGLRTLGVVAAERAGGPRLSPSQFPPQGAWIDYRGGPRTFPTVSFSQVLRGHFDPSMFRGRIVVVGATAPSLQDVHATPTGSEPMPGPEVEANAIWTALHGLPLRSAPPIIDLLVIGLLALLPALAALRLRIFAAALLVPALGALYAVAAQVAFDHGRIVAVAAPLVTLLVSAIGAIVTSHLAETRERRRVSGENEVLESMVRARTAELHETQLEIVRRLAQAAESRDEETGDHIDRISHLCRELALVVGMSQADAELMKHASLMHDVGKIGIPDAILLKPGKLDPHEWEVMKTHTTIGAAILGGSSSRLLQLAETIALTHHERWDGSGYPAGLAGDDIPLPGRICAICDVYDALCSERPYKRAWSREEALEEIARCRGTHFDPRVTDAFLDLAGRPAETDDLAEWQLRPDSLAAQRP